MMKSEYGHDRAGGWLSTYMYAAELLIGVFVPLASSVASVLRSILRGVHILAEMAKLRWCNWRTVDTLSALDDRLLNDIGVSRYDISQLKRGRLDLAELNARRLGSARFCSPVPDSAFSNPSMPADGHFETKREELYEVA